VQFVVQLNTGMDERPLAKVASGGELSRLTLALKVVLARHDAVPSLVFDEVDQGIGGEVGGQVAAGAGRSRGTAPGAGHHPSAADRRAGRPPSRGVQAGQGRRGHQRRRVDSRRGPGRELARMLGDPDGDTARRHALSMLKAVAGA
jgi:DNA repair protein RecN (Recombination protein N)